MYVAQRFVRNAVHYVLRQSVPLGDGWVHRDLVDLGSTPQRFIHYPGGGAFVIDEQIITLLRKKGVDTDQIALEELFLPFVKPHIRARNQLFADRSRARAWQPMAASLRRRILEETHVFDRRRLYYLRLGTLDMRRLDRSVTLYRVLLDKSRDELEQLMLFRERDLKPHEYGSYLFAIFDLHTFFTEPYARTMPQALDQERLDAAFVEAVCQLDSDQAFWRGFGRTDRLPPYLIRYVVMYFDYSFPRNRFFDEETRRFRQGSHQARRPAGSRSVSLAQAATIFGVSQAELARMSRQQIISLYRQKAKEMHPDKGGDHEQFIALTTAYQELLRLRP